MAIRYQVSLAHAGCGHAGSVVWEERELTDGGLRQRPTVVSLPRGFVSVTSDDGAIEILCTGCKQTVASATVTPAPTAEDAVVTVLDADMEGGRTVGQGNSVIDGDLELLFAEHPDVPPIPGDAIPQHLLDRLRHLAGRLRNGQR